MKPDEFKSRLAQDEEFAGTVARSITSDEKTRERLLDDPDFLKDLGDKLIKSDSGLLDRVKSEIDLQSMSVDSGGDDEVEYDRQQVGKEYQILAKASALNEDPANIAKASGVPVHKDTQETDFSDAGLLIPTPLRDEIVAILDSEPAFLEAGPMIMDMPQGKLDIGRQNTDPTANWQDESSTITESDPDFDLLQLDTKKLTVRHDVSNDFLRREGAVEGEDYLMDRMLKVARNKLDTAFFEGTGTQYQPAGLDQQVESSNKFSSNGNSISNIVGDMAQCKNDLAESDVPNEDRAWFMRPEVANDLMFDINSNEDTFPFRDEMVENETLMGDPFFLTTNISKAGTDTDIYYVEMSEMLVGRGTDFELASSPHQQFSDDTTVLRLISHWDFALAHDSAAAIIQSYTIQN